MSLIARYEAGEPFGDLLAEADTKLLALENDSMELAAKLGDAEHQLRGAVAENERLRHGLRAALDYLDLVPDDSVDYEAALIRVRDALKGQ